jgi:hypothetical protein
MPDIFKFILRIFLGVVCLIASRAVFEVLHLCGWYPERQLAAIVMVSPQTSFWVLITVVAISMWGGLDYLFYRRKRLATSRIEIDESCGGYVQSVSYQIPLNRAAYLIAHRSAWGRNFAAEYLILDSCIPTSEQNLMQNVAHLMTEAAMKGLIEIKGRKVGEIQFEPIHQDTWQLIHLDIQPDSQTLCRVSIKYKSQRTNEQKDLVPQYKSLSISESALRKEWPEKDRKLDASTKKFLQKAKRFGVNQQEIDKLWPK